MCSRMKTRWVLILRTCYKQFIFGSNLWLDVCTLGLLAIRSLLLFKNIVVKLWKNSVLDKTSETSTRWDQSNYSESNKILSESVNSNTWRSGQNGLKNAKHSCSGIWLLIFKVNFFVATFYDAIHVYIQALNKTIVDGSNPNDITAVLKNIWDKQFEGSKNINKPKSKSNKINILV